MSDGSLGSSEIHGRKPLILLRRTHLVLTSKSTGSLLSSRVAVVLSEVSKGKAVLQVSRVLVLVIFGLRSPRGHLIHMEWIYSLTHEIACIGSTLASLADVPLFVLFLTRMSSNLGSLHVWTVTELTLLVLEIRIVGGVCSARKLVVVAHYVVVWRRDVVLHRRS